MYVKRNLTPGFVLRYTWPSILWTTAYTSAVFVAFFAFDVKWIDIPFDLVSAVGIAVAFLIGFKNNQAYDRFWEGRKIWGQIVNYSRVWAAQSISLVKAPACNDIDVPDVQRTLVHRHLAWINALRIQLRQPNAFAVRENILVERLVAKHDPGESVLGTIAPFVSDEEREALSARKNIATHLVKRQAQDLADLRRAGAIDGFDQLMMMETLEKAYDLQGMCERIKNTPFPRQFAFFSHMFTVLFCLLLPLGFVDVFEREIATGAASELSPWIQYAKIPLAVLTSWIFLTWETVGNSSEDPFEGRPHDVSMTALCRTIEIDLRDMLDERSLPGPVAPKDHVLY